MEKEPKLNEHREEIKLFDIRWYNEQSHLLGSYIFEGSEREAREYAAGKLSWPDVHSVRILHRSNFIYEFKRL